ncbi:SAM-dependent methyltransferase [Streptomyces albireticuli]|nr:class I SAM-dependent methyltransferase [Streptomyces albireticuli]MCD9194364.1 class I SAM-dependent methyltransferase [Streptomyces albireticuli]
MDTSHPIADRYTVGRTRATPFDEAGYDAVLRRDFHDHYADGRDLWTGEEAMRRAPGLLMDALGGPGGARVLDLGTGHGRDAELLLAGGHRVTGVDIVASPAWEIISVEWPGRARFLATAVLDLPGAAEYEAVLDNGCFHHQHPGAYGPYLRRIRELLRPDGLFAVSVFHAADGAGGLYANEGDRLYREFTVEELTTLVRAHGFAPVATHRVPRAVEGLAYLVGIFRRVAGDDR